MSLIYYLLISIVGVTLLSLIGTKTIKKYSKFYYIAMGLLALLTTIFEIFKLYSNYNLPTFLYGLEKSTMKGYIAIGFFILVMFAGAMNTKWNVTRKLLSIRGEMAILGSILIMPHGIMYLVKFIIKIFNGKEPTAFNIMYIILGIIGFLIMMPLFITSFKLIRRKINHVKWKAIQRWSYLFFGLIYLHILVILLSSKNVDWPRISIYTLIFIAYTALKINKANVMEKKKILNVQKIS